MALTEITVTGRFRVPNQAGGDLPAEGQVDFRLTHPLQDTATNEIIAPVLISATLDDDGAFEVMLPATDDPTTIPDGVGYHVVERVKGAPLRAYSITLPALDTSVDLADLAPALNQPVYGYVLGAALEAETAAREAADDALMEAIAAEVAARIEDVTAEETARTDADSALTDLIATKETPTGAQAKADDAQTAAEAYVDTQVTKPVIDTLGIDAATLDGNTLAQIQTIIIAAIVDAAPGTLDTLNEVAAALQDNPDVIQDILDLIATKADLGALTAETTARTTADETLQDNIDAEATTRGNADSALDDRVDAANEALDALAALPPFVPAPSRVVVEQTTPIIPVGTGADWDTGIREIGNIVYDGTTFRTLYSGYSGAYAGNNVFLGAADSTDGKTWTKRGQVIVRSLEDPYVVEVDGTWHMFCEDKDPVPFSEIRKYHSDDFETWVDDGVVLSTTPATWEATDVSSPVVWVDDDGWHMLYEGRGTGQQGAVGYATSADGLTWTKHGSNPVVADSFLSWSDRVAPDDLVVGDGRYYMTVHAYDGVAFVPGILVSTTPVGPWSDLLGEPLAKTGLSGKVDTLQVTLTPPAGFIAIVQHSTGIYRVSFADNSSSKVAKSLFDANTILTADTDDTPTALEVPEGTLVGRLVGGSIAPLTPAEVSGLIDASALAPVAKMLGFSETQVETVSRVFGTTASFTLGTTAEFAYFTPLLDMTISKLAVFSGTVLSSGLTLARMALYTAAANGDLTIVARTASDTTLLNSASTLYEKALATAGGFPATYDLLAGVRYAIGILTVGTTNGSVRASSPGISAFQGLSPRVSGGKVGLSDLDANVASVSDRNSVIWARASA